MCGSTIGNMHFARVFGAQPSLPVGSIVSVEADLARGLHSFSIVGLADKAVDESRDRVASAIKNSNYTSPKATNKKITISLAPAELRKEGSALDIPIALAYLLAADEARFNPEGKLFVGELGLDGTIRPIRGVLSIAQRAHKEGLRTLYVPEANAPEASLIEGLTIYPVTSLLALITHLVDPTHVSLTPYTSTKKPHTPLSDGLSLSDVKGQDHAKRALEIAVAGRHNIALYGPPGTGKTMLARIAATLLPDLTDEEIVEVTTIHSFAGTIEHGSIHTHPPFRSPHHTASYASMIGGTMALRPGEVTLAHRGILFMDEFPEFHKDVINALREPLEDAQVSISRARGTAIYPANVMLIAALNPCPCGKYGTPECHCTPLALERYRRKISGPVADRIDMWVHVSAIAPEILTQRKDSNDEDSETTRVREKIVKAHHIQNTRFGKAQTNSDMSARDIQRYASLSSAAEQTLVDAAKRLKLSARGFHRTIKLARTIADLAESIHIETPHMFEALQYRAREL